MAALGAIGVYLRNFEVLGSVSVTPQAMKSTGATAWSTRGRSIMDTAPLNPNPIVQRRIQSVDSDNLFNSE